MAMLHKWMTGNHEKDNTKNDGADNAVIQASGDFAYELPNSEPSEVAGQDGAASTPYTHEKARQYTAAAEKNLGGASKVDGSTVVAAKHVRGWYNILKAWKWRKIIKRRGIHGASEYKA